MKYKVTIERTEIYREHVEVEADSVDEAENLAQEAVFEHDWSENEIIHAGEEVICITEQN